MIWIDLIGIMVFQSCKLHRQRIVPRLVDHWPQAHLGRDGPAPACDPIQVEKPLQPTLEFRTANGVFKLILQPKINMMLHGREK